MSITIREYLSPDDFMRIRDFLSSTYGIVKRSYNWTIERWNYARYFVAPLKLGIERIKEWENEIRIWENEDGEIVGVVNSECGEPGEVFFHMHPDYPNIIDEMFSYLEERFTFEENGKKFAKIYILESDSMKQKVAHRRGYKKLPDATWHNVSEYEVCDLPEIKLPEGFTLKSMADIDDVFAKCQVFSRAFGSTGTPDEVLPFHYRALQKAPDYRKDLDVVAISPDGKPAAFCLIWVDTENHIGMLEPVGTDPDFQRMGLGKAVVMEAIRRAVIDGVTKVYVGSEQKFYQSMGFTPTAPITVWQKEFGN